MRLYVHVLEARGIPSPAKGVVGTYAKLRLGKRKGRTRTVRSPDHIVWNEEFVFWVGSADEELSVGVYHEEEGLFGGAEHVRVPVSRVVVEERQTLPPTWFSLHRKHSAKDRGKILLTMSLYGEGNCNSDSFILPAHTRFNNCTILGDVQSPGRTHQDNLSSNATTEKHKDKAAPPVSEEKQSIHSIAGHFVQKLLNKNEETSTRSKNHDSPELSEISSDTESSAEALPCFAFEEALENMRARHENEMPENLQGGILLEQTYKIEPIELNTVLFGPNSKFKTDLAALQGTTEYNEGPWIWKCNEMPCLRRTVTYMRAATKIVKSVKAMVEQTYLKADGMEFAILVNVSTPDAPYGDCFQVDLLYKIRPGPELSSGEESSHLVISWNINFIQSTMMRSVIEAAARQGLKDSYEQFADLLAQHIMPSDSADLFLDKERILAPLLQEHQSDWELAIEYLWNYTVVSTIVMGLYVLLHILLSKTNVIQGLEFFGLDLPDTFGELITSGILFLQGERAFNMISHFMQARLQRGNDHGVKAQGDGWVLTVALVEGSNLPSADSSGYSDPYVVFTCNGKTKTSSVQLQTLDPQWNEILEFDAMQEPPSVLDVEVYDFEGPFALTPYIGHAEINFLKHSSAELADMWVPLEGKLAQASQSKLHLRIILENTKGVQSIKEYLSKMEKEVGKKLNLQPPHRNSTFQKLFGLPPEEFLIDDFSCYLKRKMPLQGRIFLSARIFGFYSNLFGYKTKFFFLWEDIEDIQVVPPSFASIGSPSLLIILRNGRGMEAQHGAKSLDEEGRLRFQFQPIVSFNAVNRTVMALWRARVSSFEQKDKTEEGQEDQGEKSVQIEESGTLLSTNDVSLSKAYSVDLQVDINSLIRIFDGGILEQKIMGEVGCLNYTATPWETVNGDLFERQIQYKFNLFVSIFGGRVTSTQQKYPILDSGGWVVNETMTFHDVPFGDHFQVHSRYWIETLSSASPKCRCDVFVGVRRLKDIRFQRGIAKNVCEKLTQRYKELLEIAESEILSCKIEKID